MSCLKIGIMISVVYLYKNKVENSICNSLSFPLPKLDFF